MIWPIDGMKFSKELKDELSKGSKWGCWILNGVFLCRITVIAGNRLHARARISALLGWENTQVCQNIMASRNGVKSKIVIGDFYGSRFGIEFYTIHANLLITLYGPFSIRQRNEQNNHQRSTRDARPFTPPPIASVFFRDIHTEPLPEHAHSCT